MRGHVAIITETESTYVMIESTLRFDDVEDVPGLQPLLRAVQRSRMWSRTRSGRRPGNEAKYSIVSFSHTHVVSKRGVVLFVAATACTRVTTGYSIDLLFFLAISVLLCLKVIKVRKNSRIVYHSTFSFMFC